MSQGPIATLISALSGFTTTKVATPLIVGKQSDLVASQFHGRKYLQNYAGGVFRAASQSGATLSNGLATTYTGVCLSNPNGSGKNLELRKVGGVLTVAPGATLGLGLITGSNSSNVTHTTALTIQSGIIGGTVTASVAKADAAATLPAAPVWTEFFDSTQLAADLMSFEEEMEGGIIIPPGGYAAIGATAAGPSSGFWGFMEWGEAVV